MEICGNPYENSKIWYEIPLKKEKSRTSNVEVVVLIAEVTSIVPVFEQTMVDRIRKTFDRMRGRRKCSYNAIEELPAEDNIQKEESEGRVDEKFFVSNGSSKEAATRTESGTSQCSVDIDARTRALIRKNSGSLRRGGANEVEIKADVKRLEYRIVEEALMDHFSLMI